MSEPPAPFRDLDRELRREGRGRADRYPKMIGGENSCSPPHFAGSLFRGAALVECAPAADLTAWVDVPWCAADLYFIEKVALALRVG